MIIKVIIPIFLFTITLFSQKDNHSILPENSTISFNGTFTNGKVHPDAKFSSLNSKYWCTYNIGKVTDEQRELLNFKLYEDDQLLFSLPRAYGSDVTISNSGYVVFFDHSKYFNQILKVHFYSKEGNYLSSYKYKGANAFKFSDEGNKFGVRTPAGLNIISINMNKVEEYPKGLEFDIVEKDNQVLIAENDKILYFRNSRLNKTFHTGFTFPREVKLISDRNLIAVIDKYNLKVYSLKEERLLFEDKIENNYSFRDLLYYDEKIIAGFHYKDESVSRGIVKAYDINGKVVFENVSSEKILPVVNKNIELKRNSSGYEPVPYPFAPFDSMRTIWNHYEQHGGGVNLMNSDFNDDHSEINAWSALHQGLDFKIPIGEPVYAVKNGIVKFASTIGGPLYWRVAISDSQNPGWSDGWLYAHLLESSIQVDVGDTIEVHEYLADVIEYTSDWSQLHFVEIRDSGLVWNYDDNEWGINFNPLLALTPNEDVTPPEFEDVFPGKRFAFCTNETSNYLDANNLTGEIDIIAKVFDYVGPSDYQQPAFKISYWIKDIPKDTVIFPKTLGQILNHSYSFYASVHYSPYALVIYKEDEYLQSSDWFNTERNFHHILTNNNGDSTLELTEKELAFNTEDYPDGNYRIYIEAVDAAGNSTIDSMDVQFTNGSTGIIQEETWPDKFELYQNYPNPFNPNTVIGYQLPVGGDVMLRVFDVLGNEVATLVDEYKPAGSYKVEFNSHSGLPSGEVRNLPSGIYFYRLKAGNYVGTKKMVLIK